MYIHGVLARAVNHEPIEKVKIWLSDKQPTPENDFEWSSGFVSVQDNLISPVFGAFMERQREWYDPNVTAQFAAWPEVLKFARTVRNAAAHYGRLTIKNPKSLPMTWRGLTYQATDNGRQVIGGDLTAADLIILMNDVSVEMDRIGAPHL